MSHIQHGYLTSSISTLQTLKTLNNLICMSNPTEFSYAYI